MSIIRTTLVLALVGLSVGTAACKKEPKVETLSEEEAQNPVAVFQKGMEFLKTPGADGTPQYQQAYDNFVRSSELQANPKVSFNAAWTAERLGNLPAAEKHYKAAYEQDSSYDKAMFSLARVFAEQNKDTEAVALYQAYVESHPDDLAVRNDLILALARGGNLEEAEAQAQEVLRRDPTNAAVYRALSTMYFDQGKLPLSQLANEKALAITDADPGIYNNMGVTYVLQKDNERAIERFKTAIKLDPKNFEANMNLGFIALNSGDYKLALTSFQNATASKPDSSEAKLGLAVALRGTGDFDAADTLYREIIKAQPKNGKAYFNGATLHEKYTKDFKKAQKYLDDFISAHVGEIGPDHEVYERKTRIEASIAEEKARQAAIAEAARLEKEREERNKKLLAEIQTSITSTEARIPQCQDEEVKMMQQMTLDQVKEISAAGDASMAGDLKTFLDGINADLDACINAGGAAEEGAPEEAPAPE